MPTLAEALTAATAAVNANAAAYLSLEQRLALREAAVVLAAGMTPGDDVSELVAAAARGIFLGNLGGSANALTGTIPGGVIVLGLTPWTRFRGIATQTNTSTDITVSVQGIGSGAGVTTLPLKRRDGSKPQLGDVPVGVPFEFQPDGLGSFRFVGYAASEIAAAAATYLTQNIALVGGRVLFSKTTAGAFTWYNKDATLVRIRMVGGGAGGGGGNGYAGAGGLGGNYAEGVFDVVPDTTYAGMVGAGGAAGGGGGGGGPGGNGGTTYITLDKITPAALGGTGGSSGGSPATGNVGVAGAGPGLSNIAFPHGGFELPGYGAQNGIYFTAGGSAIALGGCGGGAPFFASLTPFPAQVGSFGGTGCGGGGSGGAGSSPGGQGAPAAIFVEG